MDKEISRASAVSLGTGSYNLCNDFQTVVFKCSGGINKKLSQTPVELSSNCLLYNTVDYDCSQSNSLPLANSTFFCEEIPWSALHPCPSSTLCNTNDSRIASIQLPVWSDESVNLISELWGLTFNDRNDLIQLGHRLQDIGENTKNNPADVVRFLVASSGDVTSAEKKFRDMISWRKQNNADQILLNYHPPKQLVDHYPGAVLRGLDNEGDPIFLSRLGVTDAAGMLQQYGHNEMINHAIWLRELLCTGQWMYEYQRVHNKPVKQALVIEDVHGIQLLQIICNRPLLSLYAEIMRLDQDNFPEAAKKIIILRAPVLFHTIWNVVQHFFDANVREKMIFTTRNNYTEILAQYMDLSLLPPCVIPGVGKGGALDGMPFNFEGGRLPSASEQIANYR
jgi:CRAL/TRIO domain